MCLTHREVRARTSPAILTGSESHRAGLAGDQAGEVSATSVTGYEHVIATIARAFEKLAAERTYREKWMKIFLSPIYAAKMVGQ
jgi:hypothetical protein